MVSTKTYKVHLKPRILDEEVKYPDGVVLDEQDDEGETRSEAAGMALSLGPAKTSIEEAADGVGTGDSVQATTRSTGWLQDSTLDSAQQIKLLKLMGGKTQEDLGLLNKRMPNLDYRQIEKDLEDQWNKGWQKKKGKQLQGLGKS